MFDSLGFATPVIICCKILLREITTGCDWGAPLNPVLESLLSLREFTVQRMYIYQSLSTTTDLELHVFSNASEKAISAIAYIHAFCDNLECSTCHVMGKCKLLVPVHGHTKPRLELCAVILAAEIGETIVDTLQVNFKFLKIYTDILVVLGYLDNSPRRFYNYVGNRVKFYS